ARSVPAIPDADAADVREDEQRADGPDPRRAGGTPPADRGASRRPQPAPRLRGPQRGPAAESRGGAEKGGHHPRPPPTAPPAAADAAQAEHADARDGRP